MKALADRAASRWGARFAGDAGNDGRHAASPAASHVGRVWAVAVLAALACAVAPVAEAQPPIRIGASLSQTGVYAALGQNKLRGYQLCVKHTSEKGVVLGRKLELVVYDDASAPATAVRLHEKLIAQDSVDLVLGPYGSPIIIWPEELAQGKPRFPTPPWSQRQ